MSIERCLPKINKSRLREVHQGFTFEHEIEQLTEIIESKTNAHDTYANHLAPRAHVSTAQRLRVSNLKKLLSLMSIKEKLTEPYRHNLDQAINVFGPHSFCIKVSTGCPNACSYCAVKISRGELRSKPIDRIVEEFEEGLARGYKEFALLGTDVGAYGRDQGATLVDLLRELVKSKGDYEIRVRNIQPRFLMEMMPELREILRSGKISYLSSAAQSGNNRILGLMRRGYRIEDYKEAILTLRREFPRLKIRTQIMVGFPGETEEEFQDTLRLLDEVSFDILEGDKEIVRGVKVLLTPGHSPGSQSVAIETEKGIALSTGFCCINENFIEGVWPVTPPGIHANAVQAYDSMLKVKEIADIIIPLHEPTFAKKEVIP